MVGRPATETRQKSPVAMDFFRRAERWVGMLQFAEGGGVSFGVNLDNPEFSPSGRPVNFERRTGVRDYAFAPPKDWSGDAVPSRPQRSHLSKLSVLVSRTTVHLRELPQMDQSCISPFGVLIKSVIPLFRFYRTACSWNRTPMASCERWRSS